MRSAGRLSVDVADILGRPGSTKRLDFAARVAGLATSTARVSEDTELEFHLRCDALVEGIHVAGPVSGRAAMECSRCAAAIEREFEVSLDEIFSYPGADAGDEDYLVQGDHIELEPAVRDAIVLELPIHPLCREGCRGLCPVCGEDRNTADCGHREERVELRWEPLRRMLEGE